MPKMTQSESELAEYSITNKSTTIHGILLAMGKVER